MTGDRQRELASLVAVGWASVEATLAGLQAIDDWGRRTGDVRSAFAAAYVVVTAAIVGALQRGEFADPEWVSRVVIDFADRYRVAVRAASEDGAAPGCWRAALRRPPASRIAAIVALLHGMIAHIHYDLAHSLHACAPLDARRLADYERLGVVICGTTRRIQQVILDVHAPELRDLHGALRGADTWLTNAIIRAWRSRARQIADRMSASSSRAAAWSRRLELESAALAAGLDALAWSARSRAIVGARRLAVNTLESVPLALRTRVLLLTRGRYA